MFSAERYRSRSVSLLLCCATLIALLVHVSHPFSIGPSEYGTPALQFARTHHIFSRFIPIGYPVLVGLGMMEFGPIKGAVAVNIAIYLAYVFGCWFLSRALGAPAKQAFWIGLLFALYPDELWSINQISQTNLTNMLVIGYAALAISLARTKHYRVDALLAGSVGIAVLCRPSLLGFVVVTGWVVWKYRLPHPVLRYTAQMTSAALLFCTVTVLVHGSLFWPDMGSYVLFSGANEYTAESIRTFYDDACEGSIVPALEARGIHATHHDWDDPRPFSDTETQSPRFSKLYRTEAIKFAGHHPATMLYLTLLKGLTLLRPDLKMHPAISLPGLIRIAFAFSVPVWVLLCIFTLPSRPERAVMAMVMISYALPIVLSGSAPRYRQPVELLCIVDIVCSVVLFMFQPSLDPDFPGWDLSGRSEVPRL